MRSLASVLRAFSRMRRARSISLFSNSILKAASQICSLSAPVLETLRGFMRHACVLPTLSTGIALERLYEFFMCCALSALALQKKFLKAPLTAYRSIRLSITPRHRCIISCSLISLQLITDVMQRRRGSWCEVYEQLYLDWRHWQS